MPIKITVSEHDAYLSKIMSEYSELTDKTNEKISRHKKEVETYNKILEEYNKFMNERYHKKFSEYKNTSDQSENIDKLEKEIDEIVIQRESYESFLDNYKPRPYDENDSKILYFEEVIKLINNFKKTIIEPKNLNSYFIELLNILDTKNIKYKNRLIFLDEFQKHIGDDKIIMGIIDALEKRQNIINKYNISFDIKKQNLDIDMSLSVYIHKKNNKKTISDIYNSLLNSFIYKYNVYSYCEYAKEKLNNDDSFKDNCNKYQIYYRMLKTLYNYNDDKLDNFESEVINDSSDLT